MVSVRWRVSVQKVKSQMFVKSLLSLPIVQGDQGRCCEKYFSLSFDLTESEQCNWVKMWTTCTQYLGLSIFEKSRRPERDIFAQN